MPASWVLPVTESSSLAQKGPGAFGNLRTMLASVLLTSPASTVAYAVRSSGVAEDSAERSYAGQFDSYLGLRSLDSIAKAVIDCVNSGNNLRLRSYSNAPIGAARPPVAVLIQEMVPAQRSGVLFTRDPITLEHVFVINSTYGLGDLLVGGAITPDQMTIGADGQILRCVIGSKRKMNILTERGLLIEDVPLELQARPSLSRSHTAMIVQEGRRCEDILGFAVDQEWAIAGGHLFVLQARPIARLGGIQ